MLENIRSWLAAGYPWNHHDVSGTDSVWYVRFQSSDAEDGIYQVVKDSQEVYKAKHNFLSMYVGIALWVNSAYLEACKDTLCLYVKQVGSLDNYEQIFHLHIGLWRTQDKSLWFETVPRTAGHLPSLAPVHQILVVPHSHCDNWKSPHISSCLFWTATDKCWPSFVPQTQSCSHWCCLKISHSTMISSFLELIILFSLIDRK